MVAFRCTKRLLDRLRVKTVVPVTIAAGNILGHWYATVLTIDRKPLILALSERSLLPVILDGAPFGSLLPRFPGELASLLRALGVPEPLVTTELASMAPLQVAATANRRLLGCLNQFAFALSVHFDSDPNSSTLERELWLSDNISSTIQYNAPRELALELFSSVGTQ